MVKFCFRSKWVPRVPYASIRTPQYTFLHPPGLGRPLGHKRFPNHCNFKAPAPAKSEIWTFLVKIAIICNCRFSPKSGLMQAFAHPNTRFCTLPAWADLVGTKDSQTIATSRRQLHSKFRFVRFAPIPNASLKPSFSAF